MAIPALLYLSLALPASAGTDHSTSSVHWIAPGGLPGAAIPGASSTLVRNSSRASMTLQTSGLGAGTAATVWWVIFNNPENCVGPCSDDDKARVGVNASVLYAAGHVIGGTGEARYASSLKLGDTTGAKFGPGLLHPFGAEIQFHVRTHGLALPGLIDQQIHSHDGGCPPNTCQTIQISVHKP